MHRHKVVNRGISVKIIAVLIFSWNYGGGRSFKMDNCEQFAQCLCKMQTGTPTYPRSHAWSSLSDSLISTHVTIPLTWIFTAQSTLPRLGWINKQKPFPSEMGPCFVTQVGLELAILPLFSFSSFSFFFFFFFFFFDFLKPGFSV